MKEYFTCRGIETSAGITATILESDDLSTFCYTNLKIGEKLKEIVALSTELFDEIVFDHFFFTNCKCPLCTEAKRIKSWADFRFEVITEASGELVLKTARAEPRGFWQDQATSFVYDDAPLKQA